MKFVGDNVVYCVSLQEQVCFGYGILFHSIPSVCLSLQQQPTVSAATAYIKSNPKAISIMNRFLL